MIDPVVSETIFKRVHRLFIWLFSLLKGWIKYSKSFLAARAMRISEKRRKEGEKHVHFRFHLAATESWCWRVRARSQVDISCIFGDDGGGGLLCQPFIVYPAFWRNCRYNISAPPRLAKWNMYGHTLSGIESASSSAACSFRFRSQYRSNNAWHSSSASFVFSSLLGFSTCNSTNCRCKFFRTAWISSVRKNGRKGRP